MNEGHQKVTSSHLKRNAYLYIRQSTIKQVYENTESTQRQYNLRQRAVSLGWEIEQVIVIDSDQGISGATADREGFQRLVSEVGMGYAGIVMGLEVSRLARNSTDWHRLLEICALTNTLILDEEGIYDPKLFNDRLILGLKGTMSEAELYVIKTRLQGGILSKARRGELKVPLPVGFVYNDENKVILHPDKQIQKCFEIFFATFKRTGSARATVRDLRKQGIKFPRFIYKGPDKGQMIWEDLLVSRALKILHNPRYAGVFFFGRSKTRTTVGGKKIIEKLPMDQWVSIIHDAHKGYISWDQYQENVKRLQENSSSYGKKQKRTPPREGVALLQGLAICGKCGKRMTIRYHQRKGQLIPDYLCQINSTECANNVCQNVPGANIEKTIGEILIKVVNPIALEVSLNVQNQLHCRLQEIDDLRKKQVERARYEADLARRRYMQVDPCNRLVADSLEAEWNEKLRILTDVQKEYERRCLSDKHTLSEKQKEEIFALSSDFPNLWNNPKIKNRDRKRMLHLIIEDVTIVKDKDISLHIRFKGGATKSLNVPIPLNAWEIRKIPQKIISEIDRLLECYSEDQIANTLNSRGLTTGKGAPFTRQNIAYIKRKYNLKSRYERLRESGMLTLQEISLLLGIHTDTVKARRKNGLLKAHRYNSNHQYLYEHPSNNHSTKISGS